LYLDFELIDFVVQLHLVSRLSLNVFYYYFLYDSVMLLSRARVLKFSYLMLVFVLMRTFIKFDQNLCFFYLMMPT